MEARQRNLSSRTIRILLLAILLSLAATAGTRPVSGSEPLPGNLRTRNFVVTAPNQELASQIGFAAEKYRKKLAMEWLGRELPDWPRPCMITARLNAQAFGETSFSFASSQGRSQPFDFVMQVNGSRERILDSVLPHEISHTIFASHFGQPLPRWADEGACTTVEHISERRKNHQMLIEFLTTNRGIPFNRMFAMKNYPRDILPLYAQGYSLCRFLIQRGGKRKFVKFMDEGLDSSDWNTAVNRHYGIENLSQLQVQWLSWVKNGCPRPDAQLVSGPEIPGSRPTASSPSGHAPTVSGGSNSSVVPVGNDVTSNRSAGNFYLSEIAKAKAKSLVR